MNPKLWSLQYYVKKKKKKKKKKKTLLLHPHEYSSDRKQLDLGLQFLKVSRELLPS
jgi:hypothetical protein